MSKTPSYQELKVQLENLQTEVKILRVEKKKQEETI